MDHVKRALEMVQGTALFRRSFVMGYLAANDIPEDVAETLCEGIDEMGLGVPLSSPPITIMLKILEIQQQRGQTQLQLEILGAALGYALINAPHSALETLANHTAKVNDCNTEKEVHRILELLRGFQVSTAAYGLRLQEALGAIGVDIDKPECDCSNCTLVLNMRNLDADLREEALALNGRRPLDS